MNSPVPNERADIDHVVIVADETANWIIGGLRQLDRLALALNEFVEKSGREKKTDVFVFWKPERLRAQDWWPDSRRLSRLRMVDSFTSLPVGGCIVPTSLFVGRDGFADYLSSCAVQHLQEVTEITTASWDGLINRFPRVEEGNGQGWRFIKAKSECGTTEKELLGGSGKPQDGMVSRFLNRPISRFVTRQLLRFPITPTGWTLAIFLLPVLSFLFLCRGNYAGLLIGTLIYHLHSVLDGCDGEIARAKYLESKRGGRIDDFCDIFGCFFFVIGLGFGLSSFHAGAHSWIYSAEGLLCAMMQGANEWMLRRPKQEVAMGTSALTQAFYPRHRQMIQDSGLSFLGEKSVWWLVQITKRDVGILLFVLLALINRAQWSLHLSAGVAAVTLTLSSVARFASAGTGKDSARAS